MVTTPKHYEPQDGVDPTAVVDDTGFWARLAFKYIWRAPYKNKYDDVRKAKDCIERIWALDPGWFYPGFKGSPTGLERNEGLRNLADKYDHPDDIRQVALAEFSAMATKYRTRRRFGIAHMYESYQDTEDHIMAADFKDSMLRCLEDYGEEMLELERKDWQN